MNVGTRYPEGRIGRPREIGGRHVRKEEERLRKGGPEGLRKAHEARAGHGPEDAGAQGVVQGDREGAGQVALDGERRGGVAQVRDGAEGQARRARGRLRRPVGGLPAPGGVAALLQRVRPVPRRPHVFYEARAAHLCADSVLVSSRRGIDADEPAAAARLEAIRDCLRRGLSPEQMAARNGGPVDLSPSTIYRWVSAGYDGMTNMELRRKVGYRPRKRAAGRAATRHSARRSHAAFLALGEDACAAAWEMDTVEGAREDSACLLTLLHRPSRLQLALPLEEKTAGCVADALEGVRAILGADGTRRVFRAVLTDNGAEFSDEAAIAALLGEGPGETRLFYCDPRRSDQKGACERNHVEIRKLLPKGAGIRFDRLAPADLALAMSHVNSEPRGALGFATPARAFRAMLGEDAAALLDAYGVEDVPLGDLDLTPGLIERARAERGDAPLA